MPLLAHFFFNVEIYMWMQLVSKIISNETLLIIAIIKTVVHFRLLIN